jgi:NAD(P) transhydrogenase subunit alpha
MARPFEAGEVSMAITLAVVRETAAGEKRVALVPEVAKKLRQKGVQVLIEQGVAAGAHIPDAAFPEVEVVASAREAIGRADVLFKVRPPSLEEIAALREGAILIGMLAPHADDGRVRALRDRRITAFSMELLPRTTRAQAMDVLSSQAGMAGYKAVLIAAQTAGKFFPMLTTAAGTIRPSKVLVIGAGVAGLQAIATARRLGAQVEGFDVRPETKEQIESLGAKFLDLGVSAAGEGGYARELTAEERALQQQRLAEHLRGVDVVITTAAVPGRPAPKIVSADMVRGMRAGSVLVDLAAETGGNCELTRPGETVTEGAVTLVGPLNLPSMGAIHASEMYARNLYNFLELLIAEDGLEVDFEDDLVAGTCLTHAGEIRHAPTRERIG